MNPKALNLLQEVVTKWKSERRFTFEDKQVYNYSNPVCEGEIVIKFSNTLKSFFCNKELIEISLMSKSFPTTTLSENPLSENPDTDRNRLIVFLEEFDNKFYDEVENKLNECIDTLTTTDPLFF